MKQPRLEDVGARLELTDSGRAEWRPRHPAALFRHRAAAPSATRRPRADQDREAEVDSSSTGSNRKRRAASSGRFVAVAGRPDQQRGRVSPAWLVTQAERKPPSAGRAAGRRLLVSTNLGPCLRRGPGRRFCPISAAWASGLRLLT